VLGSTEHQLSYDQIQDIVTAERDLALDRRR
jgi:hypothetical protein